tara:strand:+ start:13647 stop:14396 length:750 start_codon:yes stop_codon:yes gene_type:complete
MSRYLLRFDDISPFMNWEIWDDIERLLDSIGVKPIVAIVPDCKDLNIMPSSGNDLFWKRVLDWQSKGWCIAMHGYDHVLVQNKGKNIVNLANITEFSGLSYSSQANKIEQGLKIFHSNKISINTWVAPAHSFDDTTLKVLQDYDFSIISDGLFTSPCRDKNGMFWIPQQLWKFRAMPFGIWTICYHHNNWSARDFCRFKKDVIKFNSNITTVDDIENAFQFKKFSITTKAQSILFHFLFVMKKMARYTK